jgi:two-component system chemotaxis sensor kinase CheA
MSFGPSGSSSQDALAPMRAAFLQECTESLGELEAGLLALQDGEADREQLNTIFRAVHSIKGGAGMFGLGELTRFAHVFETALDGLRSGRLEPTSAVLKVMLRAADVLSDLVTAAQNATPVNDAACAGVSAELVALEPADQAGGAGDDDFGFTPVMADLDSMFEPVAATESWRIGFVPHAALYESANEPLPLLQELQRLGDYSVELDADSLPLLDQLDPEEAYLGWTVRLDCPAGSQDIGEIFDFVEGVCDLRIEQEASGAEGGFAEADDQPAPDLPNVAAPVAKPSTDAVRPTKEVANPTIRVDLERVDRLINLVSELVISEATLTERATLVGGPAGLAVLEAIDDLRTFTRDIQESVMAIRAQPVKALFQRMSRLVREMEAITGKTVRLATEGEDTEVDRAVIERLTDPLTHMIRNSIDHGLERPERRLAAGKSPEGLIRISAAHRGGRIVIEITDDGRGIDRPRVRAIAIERGLISADEVLTDEAIDNLLFEPGFSTAETVTDLSGRGVGMDVVRKSVQALGGRISVSSQEGRGTTFALSLPLTLAVMDGMLVTVCGECMVVPLTALLESVQPKPSDVRPLGSSSTLLTIRGSQVPLIDLGAALNYRDTAALDPQSIVLLVEDDAGERLGLLVDDIIGQRQVVIKSLEANYHSLTGVAAATILGNGRVALILDINALVGAQKVRPAPPERVAANA